MIDILSQVKLLAHYDHVRKPVVEIPFGSVTYQSPTIQNELIECLREKKLGPIYTLCLRAHKL